MGCRRENEETSKWTERVKLPGLCPHWCETNIRQDHLEQGSFKETQEDRSQQKGAACTAPLKQPAAQEESEANIRQGWVFVERFRSRAEGTKEKNPDKSMSRCIRPERHRLVKGRMRASGLDTEQGRKRRGREGQVGSVLGRFWMAGQDSPWI